MKSDLAYAICKMNKSTWEKGEGEKGGRAGSGGCPGLKGRVWLSYKALAHTHERVCTYGC